MNKIKLTAALLVAGLTITQGVRAADASAATPATPKPAASAAKPTTLPAASSKKGLTFDKDIKPLMDASCIRCHGAQRPKAGLRLDSRDNVLKGGAEGKVFVIVGDSAKSKLVASIARINPKTAMPPEQRGPRGSRGSGGPGGPGGERPNRDTATASTTAEGTTKTSATAAAKTGDAEKPATAPAAPAGQGGQGGGPGGRGPGGPAPKPLTPEEVGLVRAWIDQGAK